MRLVDWDFGLGARVGPQELPIRDGRVDCPSQGGVDVETCFACSHMRNAADGDSGSIICDYPLDEAASIDSAPPAI